MFTIVHLYSDLLNLYGDRGNIKVIEKRCQWRGIETQTIQVHKDDVIDLSNADFVLLGGGSDASQAIVCHQLKQYRQQIQDYIDDNGIFLAVCGGYQLLGQSYASIQGDIEGLGIFDYKTIAGNSRCIGNVVIESDFGFNIVGFENHGGLTYLNDTPSLGKVIYGYGNDGKGLCEGIHYKNCVGTYIHGPLLPKNPQLADALIEAALRRKGITTELSNLDNSDELKAANIMIQRCKTDNKDNPYVKQG